MQNYNFIEPENDEWQITAYAYTRVGKMHFVDKSDIQ